MLRTYCNKLPATKSSRHNRVLFIRSETSPVPAGLLTLANDRNVTEYLTVETPTDWAGRAFAIAKLDGSETYSTFCGSPEESRCDCRGFTRWQTPCRHLTAIAKLIEDGEL